jgi:hypothetical protein
MRKQVLEFAKNGPFGGGRRSDLAVDLQKADELFITNVIREYSP